MSDVYNKLPNGWAPINVGSIIELKYGKSLPAAIRDNEGYPVFGSNGAVGKHSEPFVKGPVLIVGRKGSIGEVHQCNNPCSPIDTAYFIDEFYDQPIRFWYHRLKSLPLSELNRATALPGLNREEVYAIDIGVPPLAEQRRIVDKIEALQERSRKAREQLTEVGPLLEQFRQSLLAAAFRGDLTADWRAQHPNVEPATELLERIRTQRRQKWEQAELAKYAAKGKQPPKGWQEKYAEPESVHDTELPDLPDGWCWVTFETLIEFVTSGSRGWAEHYSISGPLFVRSQNINTDSLVLDDIAHVAPPPGSEGIRTRVQQFDVLITITGANVARAAIVNVPIDEAYVSQHVALARPVDPGLSPYLHLWTISPANGRAQLLADAYGNGKPGLNLDNLKLMKVAIAPLLEQIAILEIIQTCLRRLQTMEAAVRSSNDEISLLDQSILAKAFRGELVPQDPNDEPAAALLERIAQQRSDRSVSKPTRRRVQVRSNDR